MASEPTAEERADRLENSDCKHVTGDDAYRYPNAASCPACVADEIRAAERAAVERFKERAVRECEAQAWKDAQGGGPYTPLTCAAGIRALPVRDGE